MGRKVFGELLRRWDLSSLKVNLKFMEMEFEASEDDMTAAWDMYIELMTRVTTQELDADSGDEKTALESIHKVFDISRQILKEKGRKAPNFTKIAVIVMNQIMRPFLSKWHRKMLAGEFDDNKICGEFRSELKVLRIQLVNYSKLLADMAAVEDLTTLEDIQ